MFLLKAIELDLGHNSLSGKIPKELENLGKLVKLDLSNNDLGSDDALDDDFPAWEGLGKLQELYLNDNKLKGPIPDITDSLESLDIIKVNGNILSGNIPEGFASPDYLLPNKSDFRWNALIPSYTFLDDFIDDIQIGAQSWIKYQTLTPRFFNYSNKTTDKLSLSWTPQGNIYDSGGYKIGFSLTSGGPYNSGPKDGSAPIEVGGIGSFYKNDIPVDADTCYYIQILARTDPHSNNKNTIYSVPLPAPDNELEVCIDPSDMPVISEITPSDGPSSGGNKVPVTIIGAHFIETSEVYFDDEKADTTYDSDTKLICTPPDHSPGRVDVKVTNPGAVPLSATCTNCYTYNPPPDVVSIIPNYGCDTGKTATTITGFNFDEKDGVTVKFGGILAQKVEVLSATRIQCETPEYSLTDNKDKQVDVEVINNDNLSGKLVNGFTYRKCGKVQITSVVSSETGRNTGPAKGEDEVKIIGSGFEAGPSVTFNGIAATVTGITPTEITCITPSNPPGEEGVDVVVKNQEQYGGEAICEGCYIYDNWPEIKTVTPNNGYEDTLTPITITGSYFDGSHVIFDKDEDTTGYEAIVSLSGQGISSDGNVICPPDKEGKIQPCCLVTSPTEIKCLTPKLPSDQYDVVVKNKDGQTARCYGCYSFNELPDPVIILVDPNQGPTVGDTLVHIRGANFTEDSKVTFAGMSAQSVTFISETELTCRTPAYSTPDEPVNVSVINDSDSKSESCECYTYKNCTFEVTPNQGAASGGTEVTITILEDETDTEFSKDSIVKFGTVEVTDVTFISSREIKCKTPANGKDDEYKDGKVDVIVKTGDQETPPCQNAYTYTIIPLKERAALDELYEVTNGKNWRRDTGWGGPVGSECTWYGIKCLDGDTHVTKIDLSDNKLKNSLPASLGELQYLESLILRGNALEGVLPSELLGTSLIRERLSDFSDNKCLYATDEDRPVFDRTQIQDNWEEDQHCKTSPIVFIADPSEPEVAEDEEKEFKLKADTSEGTNNNEPAGDVVVNLLSLNPNQCEVLTESVTLNSENWETGEPVRVKGINDGMKDGEKKCTLFLTSTATEKADGKYDGLTSSITVTVKDISELAIYSASPALGEVNKKLEVKVKGSGFDDSSIKFFIYPAKQENDETEPNETELNEIEKSSATEVTVTIPAQSEGNYSLRVTNGKEGDDLKEDRLESAVTFTDNVKVEEQKRRKAIIVAGGKPGGANSLWNSTLNCATRAYRTLIFQGYTDDTIFYMNPVADTEGVDGEANAAMVYYAINFWARGRELPYVSDEYPPVTDKQPADELLIYFTGHGREAVFEINGDDETITANTLDRWLDNLQNNVNVEEILKSWSEEDIETETFLKADIDEWLANNEDAAVLKDNVPEMSGKLIFIYDACMSGSFLSLMDGVSKENERYVVTSAREDERAWFLYDGDFSFSSHFWNSVYLNGRLYKAFLYGKDLMSVDQEAQIKGVPSMPTLEDDVIIGPKKVSASNSPEIEMCDGMIQLTDASLESLNEQLPEENLNKLQAIKNKAYLTEDEFRTALGEVTDDADTIDLICDVAEKSVTENPLPLCKTLTLCAKVVNPGKGIATVLAQIVEPDGDDTGSSEDPVLSQPTAYFHDADGSKTVYIGDCNGFNKVGTHTVSVYAVDKGIYYSTAETSSIEITDPIIGDINGNGDLDLNDAILALKLSAASTEIPDAADICRFADVRGKRIIGVADAVYILRELSER